MQYAVSNHRTPSLAATCSQPMAGKSSRSAIGPRNASLRAALELATGSNASCTTTQQLPIGIIDELQQGFPRRALRLPSVLDLVGCGRSHWYALQNPRSACHDPMAPKPFKLGNSPLSPSVWWEHEVLAFLEARASARRTH